MRVNRWAFNIWQLECGPLLQPRAGLVGDIDLLKILDLVFSEVVRELDFTNEATNAAAFERSLAHLGYATVEEVPECCASFALCAFFAYSKWASTALAQ